MNPYQPPSGQGNPGRDAYKNLGYDVSRLCRVCESGFHLPEDCTSMRSTRPRYGNSDFARYFPDMGPDELEPPRLMQERELNRQEWDEEDEDYEEAELENREYECEYREWQESQRQAREREHEILRQLEQRLMEENVERAMRGRIGESDIDEHSRHSRAPQPPYSEVRRSRSRSNDRYDQREHVDNNEEPEQAEQRSPFFNDFDHANERGDHSRIQDVGRGSYERRRIVRSPSND